MSKGIYINDSIHGLISLSEFEKRIISSIGFNRLHDVYQNSTVYLTFPTNRTKRFEHSMGTMKLCSDMFYYSVLNTEESILESFYNDYITECNKILDDIRTQMIIYSEKLGGSTPHELPEINYDKFRNARIPYNVSQDFKFVHTILIQAIRVAGLLHDIGHPPFSHIVENALKNKYNELKLDKNRNEKTSSFIDTMEKYFSGENKLHEQMGIEISESIIREAICSIPDDSNKYGENLYEIMVLEMVKKILSDEGLFKYLHNLIDSSLDGDRLDYVTRDSINSGFNNGEIDYSRIINEMCIKKDDGKYLFCFPIKSIKSIEDFIKRRYNIYKDIINHHRVTKTDYLLQNTVEELITDYLLDAETPTQNEKVIPFDISGLWFPLRHSTDLEKSNALSQWNDSWLMTILKQIYFLKYYRIPSSDNNYILSQQLSELLRNKKSYYSLIKRGENFKSIDDASKKALVKERDRIKELVGEINKLSENAHGKIPKNGSNTEIDIKGTLKVIYEILDNTADKSKGFILSYIMNHFKAISSDSFECIVKDIVNTQIERVFTNIVVYDKITIFKKISIGIDKEKPIYIYDFNNNICLLDEITGVADILRLDLNYLPIFYIYILVKDEDIIHRMSETLLIEIGDALGTFIGNAIIKLLESSKTGMEEIVCAK